MIIVCEYWFDEWMDEWSWDCSIECWWWLPSQLVLYPNGTVNVHGTGRHIYEFENCSRFSHSFERFARRSVLNERLSQDIKEFVFVSQT